MIRSLTTVCDSKGFEVAFLAEVFHDGDDGKNGIYQYEIPRPFWPLAIHTTRAFRSRSEPAVAWALNDALAACLQGNKWDANYANYSTPAFTLEKLAAPRYTDEF